MTALIFGSILRNATPYLERYTGQLNRLAESWDGPIHVIAVEGDSIDGTYDKLKANPPDVAEFTLLHVEHGGPQYASVVDAQRWKQLALAGNAVLTHATLNPQTFVYVESDLHWDPRTISRLVHNVDRRGLGACSPMSFHLKDPTCFYDVWGHVKDDRSFSRLAPFFPGNTGEPTVVDSAGSAFCVTADLLPHIGFSAKDCIRGIGRTVRKAGAQLWVDPQLAVYHG
jgi:hypothetical protein